MNEEEQRKHWEEFRDKQVEEGFCPYSGLEGPECKSWLCDCFEFEDKWGVSQK